MKKKGIDYTQKGSLMKIPDPSLPLVDQLDQLEAGYAASQGGSLGTRQDTTVSAPMDTADHMTVAH